MTYGASPLPVRRQDMDFYEALKQINDGKLVTKLEWNDEGTYGLLKDGFLMIHFPSGNEHIWTLRDADIVGEDYIVIEPPRVQ